MERVDTWVLTINDLWIIMNSMSENGKEQNLEYVKVKNYVIN